LAARFGASVCVEIMRKAVFCKRVVAALPAHAAFPGPVGHAQVGNDVDYYDPSEGGSPRWALPDQIALSKVKAYEWQREFRLVFTLTDAFRFENVNTRLVSHGHVQTPNTDEHQQYPVQTESLRDICQLRDLDQEALPG
jgi:hypothetical protein